MAEKVPVLILSKNPEFQKSLSGVITKKAPKKNGLFDLQTHGTAESCFKHMNPLSNNFLIVDAQSKEFLGEIKQELPKHDFLEFVLIRANDRSEQSESLFPELEEYVINEPRIYSKIADILSYHQKTDAKEFRFNTANYIFGLLLLVVLALIILFFYDQIF